MFRIYAPGIEVNFREQKPTIKPCPAILTLKP